MSKNQGDVLRELRRRKQLSQFALAIKAGLHPATVSLAERGTRISDETAAKLARALGLDPAELQP